MKFGNPVSSVSITGGTVSVDGSVGITGTPTVDAGGSTNLGVISLPTGAISASDTVSGSRTGAGTTQLLPNSTGSTQYVLLSVIFSIVGNSTKLTLDGTGTDSNEYFSAQNGAIGAVIIQQYNLQQITQPIGGGLSFTQSSSGSTSVVVYYATIDSTTPYLSGNVIKGNAI